MKFGVTIEEQYDNIVIMKKFVSKFGKVFRWILMPTTILLFIAMFLAVDSSQKVTVAIGGLFSIVIGYFTTYLGGVIWGWTWITVNSWFLDKEDLVSSTGAVVSSTLATSYMLGGRRAAKKSAVVILLILFVCLCVGIYAGMYNFIKAEITFNKLKKLKTLSQPIKLCV